MDAVEKLSLACDAAVWETSEGGLPVVHTPRRREGYTTAELARRFPVGGVPASVTVGGKAIPVELAALPGGRRMPLLKTMLTTACERDCLYCPFRAGRDCRRVSFQADELARVFDRVYHRRIVDGLFLTTGMFGGGANTQNRLLETAEILRHKLGFRGYLHLKIMPGAEDGQILRAMQLADRVSVNLEAPNPARLSELAPHKAFVDELMRPLRRVEEIRRDQPAHLGWNGHWPSSTTQFVVGATDETDLELLQTTEHLLRSYRVTRSYFMAFNPVEGTPLEGVPAEEPLREHRLYQAFFLLRDYAFDLEDLAFERNGRLPLDRDPKQAYAAANLSDQPVEVNRADRRTLLRVPGIGPRGAAAILAARRSASRLRELRDLRRLGILAERAAPYITLDGHRPETQRRLL